MTHIVAEPVPQILAALADGPATCAEMCARLSAAHGVTDTPETRAQLLARLDELMGTGLVWRT